MRPTRLNFVVFGLLPLLLGLTGCPGLFPILSVSPTAFHFDADQREGILIVSNAGGGILYWSVESKPDWLAVFPTDKTLASGSEVVTLTASFAGIAPGDYRGTVTFTSNGGTRGVAVSATVIAPPTLEVSPTFIDFGGSATARTFEIRNTGGGLLTWEIFPPLSNWLSVSPSSGDTPAGERDTITITIDRSQLSPGTQAGPVLIQLASNAGSAIITVQAMVQSFFVDPTILDFGAQLNQLPLTIRNTGEEDVHWTIDGANLPAWASLTPDAMDGTLIAGAETTILVNIDRATAGSGTVTGEIRFTSDGGSETIHLTVQGPEPGA